MPFSSRITIPFGDTDQAGFVYYPNLFHYCHIAMERFFSDSCGVAYSELISNDRIGFPTVRINSEFNAPFFYGDEIEIRVRVTSLGNRSVTLEYRLFRTTDLIECALVTMVHVAMNLETRRPVPIPDKLREAMLKPQDR